jgi:hypothetical protein
VGYWPYFGLSGGTGAGGGIPAEMVTTEAVPLGEVAVHRDGRKEVAIPITAVAGTSDGIRLEIAKQEAVQDLPPVDIDHPA